MQKTFGEFFKEKRLEKNLTQKQLAKQLFVSESAVSKWEKDVAHPDITVHQLSSLKLGYHLNLVFPAIVAPCYRI